MTTVRTGPREARAAILVPLFLSLALAVSACTERRTDVAPDIRPAPADAPPALTAAHEAYLAGDYVEMGERLKDVLVDPRAGELARDNAFALLESAYETTSGQLPARTALPSMVKVMTLGVLNGSTPWGAHRLVFLDMHLVEGRATHIEDIRVTRLPSEPILSLADGRGTLRVAPAAKGFEDVKLEVRQPPVLPDRGVFAIQVAFDDAPDIDVFVVANKLVASAPPEVTSPDVGQVLEQPHPEIAWRPYRSPEFATWEQRAVSVGVSMDSKDVWSFYKFAPGELGQVRVGDPGTAPATLEPGSYWIDVLCLEDRTFGGIRISRAANSARPFSVVR